MSRRKGSTGNFHMEACNQNKCQNRLSGQSGLIQGMIRTIPRRQPWLPCQGLLLSRNHRYGISHSLYSYDAMKRKQPRD
jgi:hypothetical protein